MAKRSYSDAERYWIWLASVEGVGVRRFYSLIARYEDAQAVFLDRGRTLGEVDGFGEALSAKIATCATEAYIDGIFEAAERADCAILTPLSDDYPQYLSEIEDAPPVLYMRGKMTATYRIISVVGTRHCTRVGMDTARHIGMRLAEQGVTVVSGMARGIDTGAHEGALEAGGETVAVLGCGADVVYPPEARKLYERIVERGAVITEYPPGTQPNAGNFPARNRIISGMARAVVVVESPEKSGTMITVGYALEQGRDVFAVPGSILSKNAEGTNRLIREGSLVVTSVNDILGEYGWGSGKKVEKNVQLQLDMEQHTLYDILKRGEYSFAELERMTSMNTQKLNAALTKLELLGIIRRLPGQIYCTTSN